jgi:Silicon transporter
VSQTPTATSDRQPALSVSGDAPSRRRWIGRDRNARVAALVQHVRDVVVRHGLEWEDLRQALRYHAERTGILPDRRDEYERIVDAARDVMRDHQAPADHHAFRELIREIETLLNVEIDPSALDPPWVHVVKAAPKVVAAILFVVTSYVILGGLLSGESDLISDPAFAFLAFLFLLSLLAAVEALHISVTLLRLKDLNAVRDEYPRTFASHKIFRHEHGTERFLAGRQLFVIVTVFFAARLTSFPGMDTVPLLDWTFPEWFRKLFLEYGIAGALFLLWFGQLTPQFFANRRPKAFMNSWAIAKLFKLALVLESIGITDPGGWFANRVSAEDSIPVSAEERYRQAVEEIDGAGAVGVKKVWTISGDDRATLTCETSFVFAAPGTEGTSDETIAVAGPVTRLDGAAELLSEDGTQREIVASGPQLQAREDGSGVVVQSVQPRFGSFAKGDVLILRTELEFPESSGFDQTSITRPTQYMLVRVELRGEPKAVRGARVQGYELGERPTAEVLAGKRPIFDEDLELIIQDDGTPCFEYVRFYPGSREHILLAWDAEYAEQAG